MIRTLIWHPRRPLAVGTALDGLTEHLEDEETRLWVDLVDPSAEEREVLSGQFAFHPLALEDCFQDVHHPKLDEYADHVFVIAHGLADGAVGEALSIVELDLFLSDRYLVTHQRRAVDAVTRLWSQPERVGRLVARGLDEIVYHMLDDLADTYLPLLERIDEELETIEEQLFEWPDRDLLKRIFLMKRLLVHIKREALPQREVTLRLSREEFPGVGPKARLYFRDVYDRMYRVIETMDTTKDLVNGALEIYLSAVSHQVNEVVRRLTTFATVLLPCGLLAGIYGMNVEGLPMAKWPHSFFAVAGVMASVALVMYGLLRWRVLR